MSGLTNRSVEVATLVAILGFPPTVAAGQGVVRGTVADGEGAGISQVLVAVGSTGRRALTAGDGTFVISAVPAGQYEVVFVKAGFARRVVAVQIPVDAPADVDLGLITLRRGNRVEVQFTGTVVDDATGDPVPETAVTIDGSASGLTDDDGKFAIRVPVDDPSRPLPLVARRIGYVALEGTVRIPPGQAAIDVRLSLEPRPVELAEIVVEGESRLVPAHMRGFYQRQNMGIGTFFTEEQIAKINPTVVTDLLRRVPGLEVIYSGAVGVLDEPVYRFSSSGRRVVGVNEDTGVTDYQGCDAALLYIDGVRVTPLSFGLLLQDPGRLAGIEAYRGTMTPPQFDAADAEGNTGCGAIVAWTKSGLPNETGSPVVLNAFFGNTLGTSARSGPRMGANLVFGFIGPVELSPGFAMLPDVGAAEALDAASGWQALLNLRVRPLGSDSPWYVGGGLTVIKVTHTVAVPADEFGAKTYPMALTGFEAVLGPVRPFAEFHVVDVAHPGNADANLFVGVGIRLGG